jgi:hypothetical protein
MNGDLWLDEAWVANSVLMPGWREMFFYPAWLQTTPPLYLVVTRLAVALFGDANWVFRAWSLAFGLASVLLAIHLARRLEARGPGPCEVSGNLTAWFAGALIALSSSAAMFSKEGKSYSGELCFALLLMLVAIDLPAWWIGALAMLLAFGFSYSSVVFFPGILLAYVLAGRWRPSLAIFATLAGPLTLTYLFYIQPNQSDDLREMWRYAFPQQSFAGFYLRTTQRVFSIHHWEPLRSFTILRQLVLLLSGLGIARAAFQLWRQRDIRLSLVALLPMACTILLNATGRYPYDAERFSFYLFGCVVLLLVAGVDWILPKMRPAAGAASIGLAVGVLAAGLMGHWPRRVDVGLSEARQELRRQGASAGDLLFVGPQQREGYRLEQRRHQWPMEAMEGRAVSPCCPRDGRWQAGTVPADVEPEMDELIARGTGRKIWLFHLKNLLVNVESQRIPEVWQRAYLVKKGCREEFARQFQSTVLSAYRCPLL